MRVRETICAIQWIVIYPVDSAFHLLINRSLGGLFKAVKITKDSF